MLTELIYYLDVLLDQEGGGRHRAERVQTAEVPYVWYLIGWSAKKLLEICPRANNKMVIIIFPCS